MNKVQINYLIAMGYSFFPISSTSHTHCFKSEDSLMRMKADLHIQRMKSSRTGEQTWN